MQRPLLVCAAMTQIIFETRQQVVRAALASDAGLLKQFCRENPGYDIFLTGEVPDEDAWVDDFLTDKPPTEFNWTAVHKLVAFVKDDPAKIVAIIDLAEDMLAQGVGHIGLFQVAECQHGTGLAHELYQGLEDWLVGRGSNVIRLGVLDGNARGMAFWKRHGYAQTRLRGGTAPTGKSHVSHVMYKPLVPMSLVDYRGMVPRDDPSSP
jgi:GNAT superfamily N-acetyltransferase